MKLYLLRHGTASDLASSDAERELTREGEEEAQIAGSALAELGVKPSHILSSPLARARQTAEIAAQLSSPRRRRIAERTRERYADSRASSGAETIRL